MMSDANLDPGPDAQRFAIRGKVWEASDPGLQEVLAQIHEALSAPEVLIGTWRACQRYPAGAALDEAQVVVAMQRIGAVWEQLFPAEQQRLTRLLIERVQMHEQGIDIHWRDDGWSGLGPDIAEHPLVEEAGDMQEEALA